LKEIIQTLCSLAGVRQVL